LKTVAFEFIYAIVVKKHDFELMD